MSDPSLRAAYTECRRLAAQHAKTYYLATRLLPAERRSAVHALYAFARTVDDIVDVGTGTGHPEQLDRIEKQLRRLVGADWDASNGLDDNHRSVLLAVADTIRRYDIPAQHFWTFLDSMRMDLPGTAHYRDRYPTMPALRKYMRGSAAAIGLQLLPVLGTVVPYDEAAVPAAALGEAFQLTNFIRDVGEDLDRDRVYLPTSELAAFGVDEALLRCCRADGRSDPRIRRALAHLVAVNRSWYRAAAPGIDMLTPRVRPGIRTAAQLYAGILDEIERENYRVLDRRATVARRRRIAVAAAELVRG